MVRSKLFNVAVATQAHIDLMKGNMRDIDNDECMAAAGLSADDGLQKGLDNSSICWVAMVNELPYCCFGVSPISTISSYGSPWMLATNDIVLEEAVLGVKRLTGFFINEMLKEYPRLENYVDARSEASIKWLKRSGFNFDEAKRYGFENRLFYRFWMEKGDV